MTKNRQIFANPLSSFNQIITKLEYDKYCLNKNGYLMVSMNSLLKK